MTLYGSRPENAGTYWYDLQIMLRAVRTACGFSQADVAKVLGINRATYTNYETGCTCPDVITLIGLGKIFKIPVEAFLYPESYVDLRTARRRARCVPMPDPQRIGDLTLEEKHLVAEHRLRR